MGIIRMNNKWDIDAFVGANNIGKCKSEELVGIENYYY